MRHFRLWLLPILCLLALWTNSTSPSGQALEFGESELPERDPGNFAANSSDFIANQLAIARNAFKDAQSGGDPLERQRMYRRGLDALQEALNDPRLNEYVLAADQEGTHWVGALPACEALIQELPEEGREVYEQEFRDRALVELELALHARDQVRLRSVLSRYALTKAGRKAAHLFAQEAFERGDFQSAAFALERLLQSSSTLSTDAGETSDNDNDAEQESPDDLGHFVAQLAFCYQRLGERSPLEELREEYGAIGATTIELGGRKIKLKQFLKDMLGQTADSLTSEASESDLSLPTNSTSNSVLPDSPANLDQSVWVQQLPSPQGQIYPRQFMNYPAPEVPPVAPTLHNSTVLVNSGASLSAFDALSGTALWPEVTPFRAHANSYHLAEPDPNMLLTVSAYKDMAFAALENPLDSTKQPVNPDTRFGFPLYPVFPMVKRALTAVDLSSGRVLWTLGGQYEEDLPTYTDVDDIQGFAARISFHHSVVIGDTLYAVGATREGQAELFLFAIDPESGKALWYLSLCQGQQENTMFGRAAREPFPGIPVYAYGTLYICTNLGGTIAIDLGAQNVTWVSQYQALPRPYTRGFTCYYRKTTFANGAPSVVIRSDGELILVVAPTDSNYLSAYHALSGKLLWQVEIERAQTSVRDTTGEVPTIFFGVDATYAYIARQHQLLKVDLMTGTLATSFIVTWQSGDGREISNQVSGRPELCRNEILWPGVHGLVGIPRDAKRMATTRRAAGLCGNLISREDMLVCSRGVNYLARGRAGPEIDARFDFTRLFDELRAQLKKNPEDAQAQLRFAQLAQRLVGQKGFTQADVERALKQSIELSRENPALTHVYESAQRSLFTLYIDRASQAYSVNDKVTFYKWIKEANRFALKHNQERDVFRLRESALETWESPTDLRTFYRSYFGVNEGFTLVTPLGELPVGLYARLMHAQLAYDAKANEEVVEDIQYLIEWYASEEDATIYRQLVESMENVIVESGVKIYAAVETQAHKAITALQEPAQHVEQAVKLITRYPNALSTVELVQKLCDDLASQASDQTASETHFTDRISNILSLRATTPELVAAWVSLYRYHSAYQHQVAAYLMLARLGNFDPKIKLPKTSQTLGKVLEELKAHSTVVDGDEHALAPITLPLASQPAWQIVAAETNGTALPEQPLTEDQYVYVTETRPGFQGVVAYDAENGQEAWTVDLPRGRGIVLIRHGDTLVSIGSSNVIGIDPQRGEKKWSIELAGHVVWNEFRSGLLVLHVLEGDRDDPEEGTFFAIDCQRGSVAWKSTVQTGIGANGRCISGGDLLVTADTSSGPKLLKLDLASGVLQTHIDLPTQVRANIVADQQRRLYIALLDNTLLTIDIPSMTLLHTQPHLLRGVPDLFIHDETLALVSRSSATLIGYSTTTNKQLWELQVEKSSSIGSITRHGAILDLTVNVRGQDIHAASIDISKGKVLMNSLVAQGNASARVNLSSMASFDGGIAVMYRKLFSKDGRWQWGSPEVAVVKRNSNSAYDTLELPTERQYSTYSNLVPHQKGLIINSAGIVSLYGPEE